ncbi:hypothetical protein GCM10009630_16720 [Kribbella jejuensis]
MIRSANAASSAGAPVTAGIGHGFDGVGSGVSTGVEAVGIGEPTAGLDGPLEPAEVDGDASGWLSEQADSSNTPSTNTPKAASPERRRSPVKSMVSSPPGAGPGIR